MNECINCGKKAKSKLHKLYKYIESGIDTVFLKNIVTETVCDHCGERTLDFGPIAQIHKAIAEHLFNKQDLLTGKEARFLRTYRGANGAMLAKHLRKDPATIYRAEAEKKVNKDYDILIRLWYKASENLPLDYDAHDRIIEGDKKENKIVLEFEKNRLVEAST